MVRKNRIYWFWLKSLSSPISSPFHLSPCILVSFLWHRHSFLQSSSVQYGTPSLFFVLFMPILYCAAPYCAVPYCICPALFCCVVLCCVAGWFGVFLQYDGVSLFFVYVHICSFTHQPCLIIIYNTISFIPTLSFFSPFLFFSFLFFPFLLFSSLQLMYLHYHFYHYCDWIDITISSS